MSVWNCEWNPLGAGDFGLTKTPRRCHGSWYEVCDGAAVSCHTTLCSGCRLSPSLWPMTFLFKKYTFKHLRRQIHIYYIFEEKTIKQSRKGMKIRTGCGSRETLVSILLLSPSWLAEGQDPHMAEKGRKEGRAGREKGKGTRRDGEVERENQQLQSRRTAALCCLFSWGL